MRPAESIYIPGRGLLDLDMYRVHRAVQEYDPRLMFGRNEDTGDYCVFVAMPHGQNPIPVLAFDRARPMPSPEEVVRRCDAANTRKHGMSIMRNMEKHNEKIRQSRNSEWDEATTAGAEIMEWGYRRMGAHPSPRIFVPGRD